ncbi:Type II secretory pathway component PulD-like protein [Delftia sp. GW456-R20]|uniref:secretin N-terminal domain-containing protein n=1 Tax=Delftia sp. GW456-R20 TaxID=1827145 RepID=UPI0007AE4177|nr:secretin N-terminal domain-containing protein [Delftia sp. GW456-R20]KZK27573.1 Type II secretory pathway component PulD-like protein [Delftia sp. GW456-R20]
MKNKHLPQRLTCLATAISVLLLQGCTTIQEAEKNTKAANDQARRLLAERTQIAAPAGVTRLAVPRIAGKEIRLHKSQSLPAVFDSEIAYATHGSQKLSEVLEELGTRIGIPIAATEIVGAPGADQGQQGQAQSAGTRGINGFTQVEHNGSVKALLNDLAQRNQASWRYAGSRNVIEFFRFETRTFDMNIPGGAKALAASISLSATGSGSSSGGSGASGGSGGAGGSSGSGTVSVTQNQLIDPWTSIMSSVQAILGIQAGTASGQARSTNSGSGMASAGGSAGGNGGSAGSGAGASNTRLAVAGLDGFASATPELGIVTVTARPHSLQRISTLLNSINARYARNVMIDLTVYNVTLAKEQAAGLSMDLVYKQLNGNGVSLGGTSPIQPSSGQPGRFTVSFADANSRLNGTKIIAEALNTVGSVALFKKGQFLAINGQPSPFQVVQDRVYTATRTTTQTANVGAQTTEQKTTLTTGLTANVVPLILGDNRILLQYQFELSSVTSMNPEVVNGVTSYSPEVARQSMQQQAFVKDGDALVLFGFDSGSEEVNDQLSIAGASKRGRGDRTMSVIVMQVYGGQKNG